jgi:transcription antitermination protein NusB
MMGGWRISTIMQPRRLARELAFLCLTQLAENAPTKKGRVPTQLSERELQDLLIGAVRFLREECEEHLKQASVAVQQSHEQLLQSDIGSRDIIQARERLNQSLLLTQQAINTLGAVLELPERVVIADHPEVRPFTLALIRTFVEKRSVVEETIKHAMVGWQWDRIGRIEQEVLHLSVTEFLAFPEIPAKVSISEAVELAKRYGGDATPAFVNGVLRRVLESLRPQGDLVP